MLSFPTVLLYASTLLVSATLLFSVQPLFAKMLLPLVGGAPAVWNTCLVFFQALLLAGYAYAHLSAAWLRPPVQMALHVALIAAGLVALPFAVPDASLVPTDRNPIPWLLLTLIGALGVPFFVISSTAPMLQRWFSRTTHPDADDPYFLYAVSNVGSLVALLGYPLVVEPNLTVSVQRHVWAAGYVVLLALVAGCAGIAWVGRRDTAAASVGAPAPRGDGEAPVGAGKRLRWVALAAVPSSLMLGVTTHLTSDISPIPLLWVVPLALYLATFVLVFAKHPPLPHRLMVKLLPMVVVPLVAIILFRATGPLSVVIGLHLLAFFVATMVCHGELSRTRPPASRLTEFYLWMSVGGMVGGLFNSIVAPLVFDTLAEYPLALVVACLLTPGLRDSGATGRRSLDIGLPALLGVGVAVVFAAASDLHGQTALPKALLFGVPALVVFAFRARPVRFGLGTAALFVATPWGVATETPVVRVERSFFGVHRVANAEDNRRVLYHGTTIHGAQNLDPDRRSEPLLYFHRNGPLGDAFSVIHRDGVRDVAVIGLGTGSVACYAVPGQRFTFYEIDPTVVRIAQDPRSFTFLRDCPGAVKIVLGDARLSLPAAPDRGYGAIVIDAFTSDAIPTHLLTREAMRVYLGKLRDDGLLVMNISNRYLDVRPVVGALARDFGLVGVVRYDPAASEAERKSGKAPSLWAVVARSARPLATLTAERGWIPLPGDPGVRTWTDDYSNVLALLKWK